MTNRLENKVSYEVKLDNSQIVQVIQSMGCVLDRMYDFPTMPDVRPMKTSKYNALAPGSVMEQEKAYALV